MTKTTRLEESMGNNAKLNLCYVTELAYNALEAAVASLGEGFSLRPVNSFEEVQGKGYSAKFSSRLTFKADPVGEEKPVGKGEIVSVLFKPGDGTGKPGKWTPVKKEGEAELYLPVGTAYGHIWIPGITSLAVTKTPITHGGSITSLNIYKWLTLEPKNYVRAITHAESDRRSNQGQNHFDFTFEREYANDKPGYGDPHATIWNDRLHSESGAMPLSYINNTWFQIGAFLNFPKPCEELDLIRSRISQLEKANSEKGRRKK